LLKENQEKDGILELFKINKEDVEEDMGEILSLRKKVAELKSVIK
jgi:hypothetical protein